MNKKLTQKPSRFGKKKPSRFDEKNQVGSAKKTKSVQ